MFTKSALDILDEEKCDQYVMTMCKSLDRALGGGIILGIITEFVGLRGSGKTQICKQLCVNVQVPKEVNGIGGKAIYIETNQGFNPERLREIATNTCAYFHKVFPKEFTQEIADAFTVDNVLQNISYAYCENYMDLIAAVEATKEQIKTDPEIKLIIIDSFSYTFRNFECIISRTRILQQLLTELQIIADTFHIAVVLTNELTTKFVSDKVFVHPALGDSHGHKIGQRIVLGKNVIDSQRIGFIDKSITSPQKYFRYQITEDGVRGMYKNLL